MRKIIFLDVDGVLNNENWIKDTKTDLIPEKIELLKEIVEKTGAKIVLSSSWRVMKTELPLDVGNPMLEYLEKELKKYGLTIYDKTPVIGYNRPKEIKAWLEKKGIEDVQFVSLDDDFIKEQYEEYGIGHCLIKTLFSDVNGGLRQEHVEKAVEILNLED